MGAEPTLAEIIRLALDSRLQDVHVALPCRVEKFDAAAQTVDALPMVRRAIEDTAGGIQHENLPVLPNVPVLYPRSAAFSATWPIVKGDFVLVVFCSSAIAGWRESGDIANPGDLRRHDLSYGYAIPGVAPDGDTAPSASDAAVLEVGGAVTHVRVGSPAADFVALSAKVATELAAIASTLTSHTHTGSGCLGAAAVHSYAPGSVAATKLKSE